MDILKKIKKLKEERGWSNYRLSIESGITVSTITNMFSRNTLPSITTLTALCEAFNISVAQFFAEDDYGVVLSEDENELVNAYRKLSTKNKKAMLLVLENMSFL